MFEDVLFLYKELNLTSFWAVFILNMSLAWVPHKGYINMQMAENVPLLLKFKDMKNLEK